MKFLKNVRMIAILVVALLRGGAWIEIGMSEVFGITLVVALLRGGAWIEIPG